MTLWWWALALAVCKKRSVSRPLVSFLSKCAGVRNTGRPPIWLRRQADRALGSIYEGDIELLGSVARHFSSCLLRSNCDGKSHNRRLLASQAGRTNLWIIRHKLLGDIHQDSYQVDCGIEHERRTAYRHYTRMPMRLEAEPRGYSAENLTVGRRRPNRSELRS